MIEKVIILKTLKSGKTIWKEGQVLFPPLPPDILKEVELETGTVKALYGSSFSSPTQGVHTIRSTPSSPRPVLRRRRA